MCLDTYPPITPPYMNQTSHGIVQLITQYNNFYHEPKVWLTICNDYVFVQVLLLPLLIPRCSWEYFYPPPRMECWSIAGWPVAYTKVFLTGRRDPFILCLFCYFLYHLCFYFILFFLIFVFSFCFLLFEPVVCHSKSTAINNRSLLLPYNLSCYTSVPSKWSL